MGEEVTVKDRPFAMETLMNRTLFVVFALAKDDARSGATSMPEVADMVDQR